MASSSLIFSIVCLAVCGFALSCWKSTRFRLTKAGYFRWALLAFNQVGHSRGLRQCTTIWNELKMYDTVEVPLDAQYCRLLPPVPLLAFAYPHYWNIFTFHRKSQFGGEWNDHHAWFPTIFVTFWHGLKLDFLSIHVGRLLGSICLPCHDHEGWFG